MKMAICRMTEIAVQGFEYGRSMGNGAEVNLDEVVAPGLTLEQALGPYIANFELVASPIAAADITSAESADRRRPRGTSPSQT